PPLVLHSFPTRRSSDLLLLLDGGGSGCASFSLAWWRPPCAPARHRPSHRIVAPATAPTRSSLRAHCCASATIMTTSPDPLSHPRDRKSTRLNSSHVSIS